MYQKEVCISAIKEALLSRRSKKPFCQEALKASFIFSDEEKNMFLNKIYEIKSSSEIGNILNDIRKDLLDIFLTKQEIDKELNIDEKALNKVHKDFMHSIYFLKETGYFSKLGFHNPHILRKNANEISFKSKLKQRL